MEKLTDRVAIITGGGTGIGEGIAGALASEEVRLVLCGRRAEPIEAALKEIRADGGTGIAVQADVSKAEDAQRVVEKAVQAYGTVDILVNNAGIGGGGPIHAHDVAEWDQVLAVNLRGPFLMARAVLPLMRKQRRGHIINISSESGLEHYEGDGAYGVSKHGLNALGEYI